MKLMKRVVTLMLTAFLVAGVFAPVQTEAASLSVAGIKFYSWSGAGECFMVTKAQNIYEFQYQIFNNAGTYVKTKKPKFAIRFSRMNLRKDGGFVNIPLYLAPKFDKCL